MFRRNKRINGQRVITSRGNACVHGVDLDLPCQQCAWRLNNFISPVVTTASNTGNVTWTHNLEGK